MKYAHILMAVAGEIWAIEPDKLQAIIGFLATQSAGVKFSAEEIEARIAPQTAAATARREGVIAVLPLHGVMANRINMVSNISGGPGGTTVDGFGAAFDAAVRDEGVKAIVIDVDSPGGSVHGVDELAAQIAAAKGSKPIIAQVNAKAASAAYWAISPVDEIVVTPSGMVGSIGALCAYDDVSAAMEKEGVARTFIGSSEFKAEGRGEPLTDSLRDHLQSMVDSFDAMFVDRVASSRGVATNLVRESYGRGRMVLAKDAVAAGMADRVGTMAETLARFGAAPSSTSTQRRTASARQARALALH